MIRELKRIRARFTKRLERARRKGKFYEEWGKIEEEGRRRAEVDLEAGPRRRVRRSG
jgi:hypothetical protein